ncbi:uncharacterized protein LOC110715665 [Chenopodium quinoa]|uniref:uncharacterized protein LOC110715665 n=1 Tax=Chenopodium quinoa TaxID=63459 RepID=UPI000B7881F2|nr:uncharacterized protein LOC110715665 [Chenopodium quinoa]
MSDQLQVAQAQAQAQVMQQYYMSMLGVTGTMPGISPNYCGNPYPSYNSNIINGPQNGGTTSTVANTVKMMLEMMGNNGTGGLTGSAAAIGGIGATGFGSEGFSALCFLGGILGGFGL